MSRNVLYLIVAVLLVFLVIVLLSGRNTVSQTGLISPTPAQGTINSEVTPTDVMELSPTSEVSVSPTGVTPTVVVTVSPTQ